MGRYSERFTRDVLYTLPPFLCFRKENRFIRIHCNRRNRNLFLFFLDCTAIIDNDIVRGREREARGMNGKMERTAPAKRETVVVEGETTPKKEPENNGEFNMAPRGSFNHLIESPAYLGSPPRRLHLASSLSSSRRIPPSKGRRLLKDEFAHIPFLSPPPFPFAFRWAVANPLSSAISGCKRNSSSLDRYPRRLESGNRINGDPRQQYSNTKALTKPSRVQGKHSAGRG